MRSIPWRPAVLALLLAPVFAAAQDGGAVSFQLTPYPKSTPKDSADEAFTDYERIIGVEKGAVLTETLEGAFSRRAYHNPKGRSTLEILRNYEDALASRGFTTLFECKGRDKCQSQKYAGVNGLNLGIGGDARYITGDMPTEKGVAHVSVGVNPVITIIDILETSEMESDLVGYDASDLAAGLDKDGKVTLQGIYFDTGLAVLKAESYPALEQVALLMKTQPELALTVVGHTDAEGDDASNQALSEQRAAAVRAALITNYGVDGARLVAEGLGESQPVADNATADGRALNRRVELVRR